MLLLTPLSRAFRLLHSFPTRRSSDLLAPVAAFICRPPLHPSAISRPVCDSLPNDLYRKHVVPQQPRRTVLRSSVRRRSEEHTSELQSLTNLVCRLLLEKKNI